MKKTIKIYRTAKGSVPFKKWFDSINNGWVRAKIKNRIDRLQLGLKSDVKRIKQGVYELRLHAGPGYRIYFAEVRGKIILLLAGGNKSTQKRDIKKALIYWRTYQESNDDH